ncbi:MAG TPA: 3-deoxy-8-phosphooctulonate synthase [Tepidisphaeraceae bacterium]|jgi:2-dehydro-3-deoxyphosphooctonate aldolase (KDO 8-P synthase)|nr:3-deoxy-8-phosphooctulonate synthase [Tepidisphaeraceae bacterium]
MPQSLTELLGLERSPLFLIAGPCVIESAEVCLAVARHVKDVCARLGITYIFKASFDKANRSSNSSFRGPGLEDGLVVLKRVKDELGLPVLSDIHETQQAAEAATVLDILQVPAFLARQTDLLIACARAGKAVNVKKGQFMAPAEMANAVEKIRAAGNDRILLTERGTFFGYNRLVNDFTALPILKSFGCPVIFDITHSTQQPAGLGNQSGGNPHYSPLLARAAVAAGVDGLFLECHPDPQNAKSDSATMLGLDSVEPLLAQAVGIAKLRASWEIGNSKG